MALVHQPHPSSQDLQKAPPNMNYASLQLVQSPNAVPGQLKNLPVPVLLSKHKARSL